MPAENEPAEPNALTQSLQLTCSLTPRSTEPSTRLVIIWLKRCCARPLIDPALEPAPVGVGTGVGEGDGEGVGMGDDDVLGDELGEGEGDGLCANAATPCAPIITSAIAAVSAADAIRFGADFAMVSTLKTCRSGRPRRRAYPAVSRPRDP